MPKVSIVLPTYNGEKYIKESIDSIINQEFIDWELIIVNDCSNDGTSELIEQYKKNDSRIIIIENEVNKKLPMSLNIGFSNSQGEYLTWTSDDNLYHKNALLRLVNYLDNNPQEMVCAKMQFIDQDSKYQGDSVAYSNEMMVMSNCVGACFLYRRNVINEIGLYDVNKFLVEDYDYWLRILFKYKNIGFIDEVLYSYRNHTNSLTSTRINEIKYRDYNLKKEYFNAIVNLLRSKPYYLCMLYFRMRAVKELSSNEKKILCENLDILRLVDDDKEIKNSIVYGAGKIGGQFYNTYMDKVICFADKSDDKIGKVYCGKEVISVDKMQQLSDKYDVVVAVGIEKIYEILIMFKDIGIQKCKIYQE